MRGLGVLSGIEVLDVPGATAGFDNDYVAQRDAALASLADRDFFLLHVEATDEAGHQGAVDEKVASLERWDADIIGPLVAALGDEPYRVLLLPDHATPCAARTHTSEPVPYLLFDSDGPAPAASTPSAASPARPRCPPTSLMARLLALTGRAECLPRAVPAGGTVAPPPVDSSPIPGRRSRFQVFRRVPGRSPRSVEV